jgi:hypothetical protein
MGRFYLHKPSKYVRARFMDSLSYLLFKERDTQAIQERGAQVALMDVIYNKAMQVNVHLGEGDERTEVAIKAVNRLLAASIAALGAKRLGIGEETMRNKYEKVAEEVLRKSFAPSLLERIEKRISTSVRKTSVIPYDWLK